MIGILPCASKTYEVCGGFNTANLEEGKLYHDDSGRLYYYSKILKRSNPETGYLPIWDGDHKIESSHSVTKTLKDILRPDVSELSKTISNEMARNIRYRQRLSENNKVLDPHIEDEDNAFTQIVKGIIKSLNITKIDLLDMASDIIDDRMIESFYSSLTKVTMMRVDKFHLWIDKIFGARYVITVYKDSKELLTYEWPSNKLDTGLVKYNTEPSDDEFKKIVKVLMVKENISKTNLKSEDVDDYTINNLMTTLHSDKALSAQLFSRFMRMANLHFEIEIFNKKGSIFLYRE